MNIFTEKLAKLKNDGLYRALRTVESAQGPEITIGGKQYCCFCSNNYLGLAAHPAVKEAAVNAINTYGVGSGASRLISGTMTLHNVLEERIALFKRKEAGIVFPTGYMANLGIISAVMGKGDLVIIDKFNHASIIDACRLSGADLRLFPHKDMKKLERLLQHSAGYAKKLIVTDSVFSMDGDLAPLKDIITLAKKYNVLTMIDEAHATGLFGKTGAGIAEYFGVEKEIDFIMGTFSKALGSLGGYVTAAREKIDFLRNSARPFIYTTALPPALCAASLGALEYLEQHPELRKRLWENADYMRKGLKQFNLTIPDNNSHIIPIVIGDNSTTMKLSQFLIEKGILIPGIRPPTVPKGTSRLRISVMATHTKEHIDKCIDAFRDWRKNHRGRRDRREKKICSEVWVK